MLVTSIFSFSKNFFKKLFLQGLYFSVYGNGLTLYQMTISKRGPNSKHLQMKKLLYVAKKSKFLLGKVENIMGKGENADYQHFSPFPKMFSKSFLFRGVKSRESCGKDLISTQFPSMCYHSN